VFYSVCSLLDCVLRLLLSGHRLPLTRCSGEALLVGHVRVLLLVLHGIQAHLHVGVVGRRLASALLGVRRLIRLLLLRPGLARRLGLGLVLGLGLALSLALRLGLLLRLGLPLRLGLGLLLRLRLRLRLGLDLLLYRLLLHRLRHLRRLLASHLCVLVVVSAVGCWLLLFD
jgi:hypothetical protein